MSDSFLDLGAEPPARSSGPAGSSVPSGVGATAGAAGPEPRDEGPLTLTPPAAVGPVSVERAETAVSVDPADAARLDQRVAGYLDDVTALDVHEPRFQARVGEIEALGSDDIRSAAAVSNRLLSKPMATLSRAGVGNGSTVSTSLVALRRTVEDLDPSRQGELLSRRKLLGVLPVGDRIRDYFARYRSSQKQLDDIINALQRGQSELQRDNVDVEAERANLWALIGRLRQYIYLGQRLDGALTERIATIEANDAPRARALKEDLLFPVRQKVQDLLTQLAVAVQGYLALDLIRRNNAELIKGVDRATTTTVSALRTAILVAQALGDQKLVLDQITALNATTGTLIETTGRMLRQQSAEISEQATSATIDLAKLQGAFQDIYATIDAIDGFKVTALDNLSRTIDALSSEVGRASAYAQRARPVPDQSL